MFFKKIIYRYIFLEYFALNIYTKWMLLTKERVYWLLIIDWLFLARKFEILWKNGIINHQTSLKNIWDKVFKNGTSEICGRQLLKNLERYGLLRSRISLIKALNVPVTIFSTQ